ncbi:hypothetical protein F4560_005749 [Saccharothrix ecbatanensis]|jgi:hypothetical protein|uniref:MYXO-CTERM domain-containing protein n=1 Tax=Saccharothrix ecbatanensis TaxID=1105145 RepID=A0A7W9HPR4_9PSEU|nr:hypothetical protein [Saccharothrix ecbatanensis]MBB5805981.1 hypothetical protein [Saccharothrix ecbatanensis]
MWRSVLAVCLLVLAGGLTVSGTGTAVTTSSQVAAVQTESLAPGGTLDPAPAPGPEIDAPQESTPADTAETRRKLWLGGIAVLLFALVYWRNKKRWSKWRAGRKKA